MQPAVPAEHAADDALMHPAGFQVLLQLERSLVQVWGAPGQPTSTSKYKGTDTPIPSWKLSEAEILAADGNLSTASVSMQKIQVFSQQVTATMQIQSDVPVLI